MRISDWSSDVCSSDLEDGCFAVNPNGRIDSAEALVDALKTSPEELRFGFAVAAGHQWHVAMAVLAEAIGADITKVRATVFDSGGKAVAALLGEHTDVRSEERRVGKECVSTCRSGW